jgi:hypothetical protein
MTQDDWYNEWKKIFHPTATANNEDDDEDDGFEPLNFFDDE